MEVERLIIKNKVKDGNDTIFHNANNPVILSDYTYNAQTMGSCNITGKISYNECLDSFWTGNQYVEFKGERYFIKSIPTSKKTNKKENYSHDIVCVSERDNLNHLYYYDTIGVDAVNPIDKYFSNSSKVLFFGDIYEFGSRLNYALKYAKSPYDVVIDGNVDFKDSIIVGFENVTIFGALQKVFELYKTPFYFEGYHIHIGFPNDMVSTPLEYGIDKSLLSITKSNAGFGIVNKITALGSSDNIPFYYPNESQLGDASFTLGGKITKKDILNLDAMKVSASKDVFLSSKIEYKTISYPIKKVDYQEIEVFEKYTGGSQDININKKDIQVLAGDIGGNDGTNLYFEVTFVTKFMCNSDSHIKFKAPDITINNGLKAKEFMIMPGKSKLVMSIDGLKEFSLPEFEFDNFNELGQECILTSKYSFVYDGDLDLRNESFDFGWLSIHIDCDNYSIQKHAKDKWCVNDTEVNMFKIGVLLSSNYTPTIGDFIKLDGVNFIPYIGNVTLPIYRNSKGAERYITTQDDSEHTYNNPFNSFNPHEYILRIEDIKPTIKEVPNSLGERIDTAVGFSFDNDDNDDFVIDENGNKTDKYQHSFFYMKLQKTDGDYEFNLFSKALVSEEVKISMTSGECAGCTFTVQVLNDERVLTENQTNPIKIKSDGTIEIANKLSEADEDQQDTSKNEVTLILKKEYDTFGILMPNVTRNLKPKAGDTFVILGIQLPQAYIRYAENRLQTRTIDYLRKNNDEKFKFNVELSRIFLAENENILNEINENSKVNVVYNNKNYPLYITGYSYVVKNKEILPKINISLAESISSQSSSFDKMTSAISDEVYNALNQGSSNKNLFGAFISKNNDDTARGKISFEKGYKTKNSNVDENGNATYNEVNSKKVNSENVNSENGNIKELHVIDIIIQNIAKCYGLTVDNIANIKNAIVEELNSNLISSKKFISGENGIGFKLSMGSKFAKLELDDITARNIIISKNGEIDKLTSIDVIIKNLATTYDLTVQHVASVLKLIGNEILSDNIHSNSYASGFTGNGYRLWMENGNSNLEVDNITARKIFTVFELLISKVRAINGGLIISPANGTIKEVETNTTNYVLTLKEDYNSIVAGDILRCQVYKGKSTKYYSVIADSVTDRKVFVLKTEFNGVIPEIGDELIQVGNTTDNARQSIIYLTASDTDGKAHIDLLDNVNSKNFTGKINTRIGNIDIYDSDFGDNQPNGKGIYTKNLYAKGELIIVNKAGTGYTKVSSWLKVLDNSLESKYNELKSSDNTITQNVSSLQQTASQMASVVEQNRLSLQSQIDGQIESYYKSKPPYNDNGSISDENPESAWINLIDKERHLRDVYTDYNSGKSWRYTISNNNYKWVEIQDTATSKALAEAAKANANANEKKRIFTVQPVPPYDIADLWVQGPGGDVLICKTARDNGALFVSTDWEKGSKYTDDSKAIELAAQLSTKVETNKTSITQNSTNISLLNSKFDSQGRLISSAGINIKNEAVTISAEQTKNAINDINLGNRNLLLDSGRHISNNNYNLASYTFSEPMVFGETYTVVLKGKLGADRTYWYLVNSNYTEMCRMSKISNNTEIYALTFTMPYTGGSNTRLDLKSLPSSSTSENTIEWIKLVQGNKTSLDWSEATEDLLSKAKFELGISKNGSYIDLIAQNINLDGRIKISDLRGTQGETIISGGKLDTDFITTEKLIVGDNITMGPNAKISWGNVSGGQEQIDNLGDDINYLGADVNDLQGDVNNLGSAVNNVNNKVDGLEVGERNLLLDSGRHIVNHSYAIASYQLSEAPKEGEEVRIVLKGKLGSDKTKWLFYNSGGSISLREIAKISTNTEIYVSSAFNWRVGDSSNTYMNVYAWVSTGTSTSEIEWIKLVRGNKTSLDWSPAPEDTDTKINDIEIGGTNLATDSENVHINIAKLFILPTPLEKDDEVTISFEAATNNRTSNGLYMNYYTSSDTHSYHYFGALDKTDGSGKTFTIKEHTVSIRLYATNTYDATSIADIVKLKIERGNKATDWSASTEDAAIYSKVGGQTLITNNKIRTSLLEASEIRSNIINTTYLNGLSLNFTKGHIGKWNIEGSQLSSKNLFINGDYGQIYGGGVAGGVKGFVLRGDGSGYLAKKNITWDGNGNTNYKGKITASEIEGSNISGGEIIGAEILTAEPGRNRIELSSARHSLRFINLESMGGSLVETDSLLIQGWGAGDSGATIRINSGNTGGAYLDGDSVTILRGQGARMTSAATKEINAVIGAHMEGTIPLDGIWTGVYADVTDVHEGMYGKKYSAYFKGADVNLNGVIVKRGNFYSNTNGDQHVTFTESFPNGCFSVIINNSNYQQTAFRVYKNYFVYDRRNSISNGNANYVAFGW